MVEDDGYACYPITRHYYTEKETPIDGSLRQLKILTLTDEEVIDALGSPPKLEDLPDWLVKKEKKEECLDGYFSQLPHRLLCDSDVPHITVRLFAVYHKFCKVKNFAKNPSTFVGKKRVAEIMGITKLSVMRHTRKLEEKGWLTVESRRGQTNRVTLHGEPKKQIH